jgi:putative radical SAM enzyme (TIGR03279 family)
MVEVTGVLPRSKAEKAGVLVGDILLEINSRPINDVLDYRFRLAEESVTLKLHRGADIVEVKIKKDTYDDIGLEFGTPLMDKKHRCENGCIFCFIDQNPRGMRETIYFKDDDSRLAFLHGNYITLTNLHDADIDRIIEMHISPVNVSVHTTNPTLRVMMMKNKRSGEVLSYLDRLADAGITLRGQIVLCRGINDGAELDRSMRDLSKYYPKMDSVSVVPAGLTAHREGLYHLEPFTAEECAAVIRQIDEFNKTLPATMFFASDEFYVKSGTPLPESEHYGEFTQIENGVGLLSSFGAEFDFMLGNIDDEEFEGPRKVSVATGEASYEFIKALVDKLEARFDGFKCNVYKIKNNFFGGEVTVTGLLTGRDIAEQLAGEELGETLYLSRTTLRSEGDLFLCGMSTDELSQKLGVPLVFSENDGAEFVLKLLGLE